MSDAGRLTPSLIDEYAHFAELLADAAAEKTLPHFRADLDITNKDGRGGFDPVTLADRDAETAIRELIEANYPEHGIIGEEHGVKESSTGVTWVLDPVDGTRSFVAGVPLWGTLIALNDGNEPVIGLMDQPYTGERFLGRPGGSELISHRGNTPLRTRACTSLSDAMLGATDPSLFTAADEIAAFSKILSTVKLRRFGGDCYFYCLVAAGMLDIVVESGLQTYDIQALIPIVREAGGVITDWKGGDPQEGGQAIAAATPELHAEALEILSSAAR